LLKLFWLKLFRFSFISVSFRCADGIGQWQDHGRQIFRRKIRHQRVKSSPKSLPIVTIVHILAASVYKKQPNWRYFGQSGNGGAGALSADALLWQSPSSATRSDSGVTPITRCCHSQPTDPSTPRYLSHDPDYDALVLRLLITIRSSLLDSHHRVNLSP